MKTILRTILPMLTLAWMGWIIGPVAGQQLDSKTAAYQGSVMQEQLRLETRRHEEEMVELLKKLQRYGFTKLEHAELKEVLGKLDEVAEQDMTKVVKRLKEASCLQDESRLKESLLTASAGQKGIASELRHMADHLLLLRDREELKTRIRRMALRQKKVWRDTKELADLANEPARIPDEKHGVLSLVQLEQETVARDVIGLKASLQRLMERGIGDRRKVESFWNGYQQRQLDAHAEQSMERVRRNLQEAQHLEKRIYEGLLQLLVEAELQKPLEQQLRELAAEVRESAMEQERLAQSAANATAQDQESLKKEQQQLADRLELVKEQLQPMQEMNRENARQAAKVQKEAESIAQKLDQDKLLDEVEQVAELSDAQKRAAEQMRDLEQSLLESAQEAAENDASNPARQAMALADKLERMSQEQQELAAQTQQSEGAADDLRKIRKEQEALKNSLEESRQAIDALSPEAGENARMAGEQAQQVEQKLAEKGALKEEQNKQEVASGQQDVAKQMQKAGEALREKAQELAANGEAANQTEGMNPSPSTSPLSDLERQLANLEMQGQQIAEAMHEVMTARSEIELGQRLMDSGSKDESVMNRVSEANEALENASELVREAGEMVNEMVSEDLQQGREQLQAAAGQQREKEKQQGHLQQAKVETDEALQGLQQAAKELAKAKQQAAAQIAEAKNQTPPNTPSPQNAQTSGNPKHTGNSAKAGAKESEALDLSVISKLRSGQRDALELLKQEKASPDFETMVQQYIRNLADGQVPAN